MRYMQTQLEKDCQAERQDLQARATSAHSQEKPSPRHKRTGSEQDYHAQRQDLLAQVPHLQNIADDFPMFIPRQRLIRYLTRYELFKLILDVKGSVVECGVHRGASLMLYNQLSTIFEPYAYNREIIGFDTFEGFVNIDEKDGATPSVGGFGDTSLELINECVRLHDMNRPVGHIAKVKLVKGDATTTIPTFFNNFPYVLVALLYLDFDLYAPTKAALETIVPRMPKGAVIAFDEINDRVWPGETIALIESGLLKNLKLRKFPSDPSVSYAVLE